MTGPLAEIRNTGCLGPAAARLIYRAVDAARRFGGYPPPEGYGAWGSGAVEEVAHDFLTADGAEGRMKKLVAAATDEDSFSRLVQRAVHNHFRMEARRTDRGAALRAIERHLQADDSIVAIGEGPTRTWALLEFTSQLPYSGNPDDLVAAAQRVANVQAAAWSATSARRRPLAEAQSLKRILHAILLEAAAPVGRDLLLEVVLKRFPMAVVPPAAEADEALLPASMPVDDTDMTAEEIWAEMNDNERLVVPFLDETAREIARQTGLSRSTAHRACVSAKELLRDRLPEIENRLSVMNRLAWLSETVRARGTAIVASASSQEEGEHEAPTPD